MHKLIVFNHLSLDGYFVDSNNSMTWAKMATNDPEWNAFVEQNASGDGTLLFGRITYNLMTQYWPTPMAHQHDPKVAERMNALPKIVFSRTLEKASWSNTRLLKGDLIEEIRKLKNEAGGGMTILGSGSIVAQLAPAGLIDEYQFVVNPVALGNGRTMFEGMSDKLCLKLTNSRTFKNGNFYVSYVPAP